MYDQPVMVIMPDLKSDGQEFGRVPPGKSVSGYQAQPTRSGAMESSVCAPPSPVLAKKDRPKIPLATTGDDMNFLTITCKNRFKKAAGSPWDVVIKRHFLAHYDPRASDGPD